MKKLFSGPTYKVILVLVASYACYNSPADRLNYNAVILLFCVSAIFAILTENFRVGQVKLIEKLHKEMLRMSVKIIEDLASELMYPEKGEEWRKQLPSMMDDLKRGLRENKFD